MRRVIDFSGRTIFLLIVLIAILIFVAKASEGLLGVLERSSLIETLPTPPAPEEAYYMVDVLPSREDLPSPGPNADYGACLHINYEDLEFMQRDDFKAMMNAASANSRCALLYVSPSWAGRVFRHFGGIGIGDAISVLKESGFSLIVLRIHVRINRDMWNNMDRLYEEARSGASNWLIVASKLYGEWVAVWKTTPLSQDSVLQQILWFLAGVSGGNVAMDLAKMGVYVQLFNEPNHQSEWDGGLVAENPHLFDANGFYRGSLSDLGRKVCLAHLAYISAFFPTIVYQTPDRVWYDLSVPQPLLVIPDLAGATAHEKLEYLEGCLSVVAERRAGVPLEYVVYTMRGAKFAYGFHIYLPCHDDPFESVNAIRNSHIDVVANALKKYSLAGLDYITDIFITEFGGAFAPGSGCNRKKQKEIYTAFTAMYPDIPAFWWIYAGNSCNDGDYAGNTPEEWNKSAIVSYSHTGGRVRFQRCSD